MLGPTKQPLAHSPIRGPTYCQPIYTFLICYGYIFVFRAALQVVISHPPPPPPAMGMSGPSLILIPLIQNLTNLNSDIMAVADPERFQGFHGTPLSAKKLTTSSYNGSAVTLHCNRNFAS